MTTPSESMFVDTNVLVFAKISSAPHHGAASKKLAELRAQNVSLWVSRQVLREYMVFLTRPRTFSTPLSPADVATDIREMIQAFNIAEDGPSVTGKLLTLLESVTFGGKQVHDANIVATMLVHGIPKLLTDNVGDFTRFSSLITIVPLT